MIATRWFAARRGLVTGLLTAANSTGQLIFLPLMSHLAMDGWRWAMAVVAGAALVALPIAGPAAARPAGGPRPRARTAARDRAGAPATPPSNALKVLGEAMRTGTFWALAASFFVCGATTVGLIAVHFIPAAHDHGMPATQAASMLAAMGVLDIAGTTASGWLTDRTDPRMLLFWYYALRGVSLVLLSNALSDAELHARPVRRLLRAGLDRDRAADRRADRAPLRAREGRDRLRLGVHVPPDRRRRRGLVARASCAAGTATTCRCSWPAASCAGSPR